MHRKRELKGGRVIASAVVLVVCSWSASVAAQVQPDEPVAEEEGTASLRLHVIDNRSQYAEIGVDVYDAEARRVVVSGTSVDEATGAEPLAWELDAGLYKIVRAGEPFDTYTDFATVELEAGATTDFVIVVDAETGRFRGGGVVTTQLPSGVTIAGVRLSLNGGGSLMFSQQNNVVGQTSGTTAVFGLFGNFGLVFDRDNHFVDVGSELDLSLLDRPAASVFATTDLFTVDALYAYNINNPYIGPYVRGSLKSSVFPSYLYLESGTDTVTVTKQSRDGTVLGTETYGGEANQDDLRVELAPAMSPIVLQEEVGANLKAVDLDLVLLDLVVGTRVGWAFRQGLVNDLFVVEGDGEGPDVTLVQVDDYNTFGPAVGADASVTVTRWLFGSAQAGIVAPLKDKELAGDSFGERLLITFSGSAGFRVPILTDLLFATLDYSFRLERDGFLTPDTQFEHSIMARASVSLF